MIDTVTALYREVFSSESGRMVLAHMLVELHFFDEVDAALVNEEVYLRNYARKLLYRIGIWREQNIKEIVDKLFAVSLPKEGGDGQQAESQVG